MPIDQYTISRSERLAEDKVRTYQKEAHELRKYSKLETLFVVIILIIILILVAYILKS
ncbi:hypothetical protein [Pyrococcus horikoshii]|uniref:Uncharacterized protein n=1 Tax=Pyrococcus horikoshii TaxID=53953 RepID=A0A832T4U9_PYRHR|nr:hypothetical protein [Pyrococcus horikoshii]HII60286.1 hypothetical protein [Pyrococcus horikoshii]